MPTASPQSGPVPSRPAGVWPWVVRNRGNLLIALLFVVVLTIQWPMFKGLYYRVSGAPAPAGSIAWRTDFQAALDEARKLNRPVLVDFSAEWCPPCQMMKHDVWPDAEVGKVATASFVPVMMDVDLNREVASRYGISSIPTVMILNPDGKVLQQESGMMSREELLTFLRTAVGPA